MTDYTNTLDNIKPVSTDEAFIESVLLRKKKKRANKIRTLSVSSLIAIGLIVTTITVGTANDWRFPVDRRLPADWSIPAFTFLQNVFGENQAANDSLQSDINYEVVNNTFEGLSFEVAAVYADIESLVVVIDVTSESPIFNETHETGSLLGGMFVYGSLVETGWPEFKFNNTKYFVIDENRLIGIIGCHLPVTAVYAGAEYSLHFGAEKGLSSYGYSPHGHGILRFPIFPGNADVKFTVDALNTESLIHIYPDVSIRRTDAIIREVIVTPFYSKIYFDGDIKNLFTSDNSLFWNQSYIHMIDGTRRSVVSEWQDSGTYNETINEEYGLFYLRTFCYKNLIDLEKVSAVVFMGERIPVR